LMMWTPLPSGAAPDTLVAEPQQEKER